MFDYNKPDKKKRKTGKGLFKSEQSILEEDRFSYPEDRKQDEEEAPSLGVNYVRKPLAMRGLMSDLLGFIGLMFLIVAGVLALRSQGNPSMTVAAVAASSLIFAVVGAWYGGIAFLEQDKNYIPAYLGIALCGIEIVLWVMIIIIGGRG